jgi:hypothetical protein
MGSGRFFSALRMRRGELVVTAAAMHAGAAYALLFAAAPGATEVSQHSITRILHSAMPEQHIQTCPGDYWHNPAIRWPPSLQLALFGGSYCLRMFGLTAGYHRYFSHSR